MTPPVRVSIKIHAEMRREIHRSPNTNDPTPPPRDQFGFISGNLGNDPTRHPDTSAEIKPMFQENQVTRTITIGTMVHPPSGTTNPLDVYAQVNPEVNGVKTAGLLLHNGDSQQHIFNIDYQLDPGAMAFLIDGIERNRFGQNFPQQDLLFALVYDETQSNGVFTPKLFAGDDLDNLEPVIGAHGHNGQTQTVGPEMAA